MKITRISRPSAALAMALALSACAGGNLVLPNLTGGTVTITPAQVQNAAVQACGFLPTAATVAGLITASPYLATASAVAGAICAAVAPAKAGGKLRGAPMVNGVAIHGKFVR